MQVPNFGFVVTTIAKQEFAPGFIIVVQCRSGFWLEGPSSLVCGEDGHWLGAPVCKRELFVMFSCVPKF